MAERTLQSLEDFWLPSKEWRPHCCLVFYDSHQAAEDGNKTRRRIASLALRSSCHCFHWNMSVSPLRPSGCVSFVQTFWNAAVANLLAVEDWLHQVAFYEQIAVKHSWNFSPFRNKEGLVLTLKNESWSTLVCYVESIFLFSPRSSAAWEVPCKSQRSELLWFVLSKIQLTWWNGAVDPERAKSFLFIGHLQPCGRWLLIK